MRITEPHAVKMLLLLVAGAAFCLPLVGSEDLYWKPNTDWNNPNNWKLGRVPCEGDVADFSSVRALALRLHYMRIIRLCYRFLVGL